MRIHHVLIVAVLGLLAGCPSHADRAEQYSPDLLNDPQTRFALVEEYFASSVAKIADFGHSSDCEAVSKVIQAHRDGAHTYCVPYR